jgi:hypothetical protein
LTAVTTDNRQIKQGVIIMEKQIVRVAISNNFNFSAAEFEQLKSFERVDRRFFVNSNAFVKIESKLPSFITLNPYLKPVRLRGALSSVKALRVKVWLKDGKLSLEAVKALRYARLFRIPVLLTLQRFSSKAEKALYTGDGTGYVFDAGYYRPDKAAQKALITVSKAIIGGIVYVCDEKAKGCPSCGNCARLSYGEPETEIAGLNLSASGACRFNCPSCFAKRNAARAGGKIAFDRVLKNRKQLGKTAHI